MTNETSAPEKPTAGKKAVAVAATIGGGLGGWIGSRFFGLVFWIPAIAIVITGWILHKAKAPKPFIPVLAITIGHAAWIAFGAALLTSMGNATVESQIEAGLEVIIVGLMTWWVLRRKSTLSLSAIILLDLIGYAGPLIALDEGSQQIAAILMHLILRTLGLGAAIYAIINRRKAES